jgi:hypothetical protein
MAFQIDTNPYAQLKTFADYKKLQQQHELARATAMAQLQKAVYGDQQAAALDQAKFERESAYKDMDFQREADLKIKLQGMRSQNGQPYVDEATGEVITPLPNLSATEQKAFEEESQNIKSANSSLDAFNQMKEYQNKPMFSGFGATALAAANRIPVVGALINDEKASNTQSYQNLVKTGQFKQLKATFPGAISNGERTALENLGALATYTPQEQAQIVRDAESGINKLLAASKGRAADIATGNQYRKAAAVNDASPQGGQLIGTSGGKKVFKLPDGSHVMEQ